MTTGLLACCLAAGCSREAAEVRVSWQFEPAPPVAGTTTLVRFTLLTPDGRPAADARMQLQAHMSHPGMAPVTGEVIERSPGVYEGRLQLSMAGEWVVVVTGQLADGSRVTNEMPVAAVRPSG